jgi:hypothetical protein
VEKEVRIVEPKMGKKPIKTKQVETKKIIMQKTNA